MKDDGDARIINTVKGHQDIYFKVLRGIHRIYQRDNKNSHYCGISRI